MDIKQLLQDMPNEGSVKRWSPQFVRPFRLIFNQNYGDIPTHLLRLRPGDNAPYDSINKTGDFAALRNKRNANHGDLLNSCVKNHPKVFPTSLYFRPSSCLDTEVIGSKNTHTHHWKPYFWIGPAIATVYFFPDASWSMNLVFVLTNSTPVDSTDCMPSLASDARVPVPLRAFGSVRGRLYRDLS